MHIIPNYSIQLSNDFHETILLLSVYHSLLLYIVFIIYCIWFSSLILYLQNTAVLGKASFVPRCNKWAVLAGIICLVIGALIFAFPDLWMKWRADQSWLGWAWFHSLHSRLHQVLTRGPLHKTNDAGLCVCLGLHVKD